MARQVLPLEDREHRIPYIRIETVNVMQLHLIKEREFSRHRMTQDRAATLFYTEVVFADPLTDESLLAARLLDDTPIFRLEEVLPTHVESVREIADIHQTLIFELLADHRIELLIHLAAVDDRRAAAFPGRDDAEETDARRPAVHVRALVVIKDAFVFRVGSGSVDTAPYALAGEIAILCIDFLVHARSDLLKVLRGLKAKSAKQNAAMQM
jgi:hypothetical protein